MDKKAVWQSALLVRRAIMHRYGNGMQARATSLGIDLPGLIALSAAYTFEPDPIAVERLRVRVPYFAPWDVVSGQELDRMGELFTKIINAKAHL